MIIILVGRHFVLGSDLNLKSLCNYCKHVSIYVTHSGKGRLMICYVKLCKYNEITQAVSDQIKPRDLEQFVSRFSWKIG